MTNKALESHIRVLGENMAKLLQNDEKRRSQLESLKQHMTDVKTGIIQAIVDTAKDVQNGQDEVKAVVESSFDVMLDKLEQAGDGPNLATQSDSAPIVPVAEKGDGPELAPSEPVVTAEGSEEGELAQEKPIEGAETVAVD